MDESVLESKIKPPDAAPKSWLSFLVPVYNAGAFVGETLRSILEQVDAGIEVVILDDCSTDNSIDVINSIANDSNHNLRVISHPHNMGISEARNALVKLARGDYLWFVDADDLLMPNTVSKLRNIIAEHEPDWVVFDYEVFAHSDRDDRGEIGDRQYVRNLARVSAGVHDDRRKLFRGMFLSGKLHVWSRVIKKTAWDPSCLFPTGKYFEDITLTPRLALDVRTYYYLREAWIAYRRHSTSIVNHVSREKVEHMSSALVGVLQHWKDNCPGFSRKDEFAFLMHCGRVQINSIKMLRQLGLLDEQSKQECRRLYYETCGKNKSQVVRAYLRAGEWIRLFRLLKYV